MTCNSGPTSGRRARRRDRATPRPARGREDSAQSAARRAAAFSLLLLSQKGSLYATRPTLDTYTAKREDLLKTAQSLFDFVIKGAVKIPINHVCALKDAPVASCWKPLRRSHFFHHHEPPSDTVRRRGRHGGNPCAAATSSIITTNQRHGCMGSLPIFFHYGVYRDA